MPCNSRRDQTDEKDIFSISTRDQHIRWLMQGLAILPFLAFVLFVFISAFSKSDSFIGWDTSTYVYSVRILEKEGLLSFLRFFEFSRFPYSVILYLLYSAWPQGLFVLTRILPTLLALMITVCIGLVLLRWFKDNTLAIFGIIFSCVWIAPYILASNLFAQLLSLVLSLLWLAYAFTPQTKRVQALTYTLFLIASISHVYTMIFIYMVYILSNLTLIFASKERAQNDGRAFIVRSTILGACLAVPLIVSTITLGSTRIFGPLLNPQQIVETGIRPIANSLILISFGGNAIFVIPIAFLITLQSLRTSHIAGERLRYLFILWWTILALTMLAVPYIWPYLASFAERMIIITPIPMLLALFARKLPQYLNSFLLAAPKIQSSKSSLLLRSKWFKKTLPLFLVLVIFVTNINPILDNSRVYLACYISSDISNRLESLRQIMQFRDKPLFIIDRSEDLIGDYADLWDNTIGAYIGPHYVYLGSIQNLANLRRTVFSSVKSDIWAMNFFNKLSQDNILSYDGLASRAIVLLDSFYVMTNYEASYVNRISDGVFTVDFEKLWTDRSQFVERIFIEADAGSDERVGPWYGIKRDWSLSSSVLELYANVSGSEFVDYRFYVYNSSLFSLKIRYFDFAGYSIPLVLSVDNMPTIGEIRYQGLQIPQEIEVAIIFLSNGWHELSIRPGAEGLHMVNLDYILIEQVKSS